MSFAGLTTFKRNSEIIVDSMVFQKANDAQKMDYLYRLLNSKYGINQYGVGVKKLEVKRQSK